MQNDAVGIFKKELANRMRRLREKRNLTQQKLATEIGFKDKQVVNNYEINGANPTAFNLVAIAKALNVTLDDLLNFNKSVDSL